MDRNDDDEYAEPDGVDPEWNPFSTPRSLDDGPGWDDGSPHAGGVSRMPKRLIVVITIVTLTVAVVSIGLVITESNMSVHRHQLASACETAVAEMGQARERLDGQVAERFRTIDLPALSKRQKHEYESLRKVAKPVSIDCDASQRNSRLGENTRKATRSTRRYERQSEQVAAFARKADRLAKTHATREDTDRLARDIDEARSLLDETEGMELVVPYLRTRLSDTLARAEQTPAGSADMESIMSTLEDLMNQVRENAGL